ncbi:NUDIX hydrolase [Corynebacterium sp. H113]|uniref:NUDIX hydrolase n=1 Tax=Corynebacterium sp. H113 TaxID=3133419 RepID=UPI0030992058
MPTPQFIVDIREKIGHDLLWLPGTTSVVLRERDCDSSTLEVLLVQRSDNGEWTPITGICEPGEEAHVTAAREVLEETGVAVDVEAVIGVVTIPPLVHANGDKASYLSVWFRCCPKGSTAAHVADDESSNVAWVPVNELPPMLHRFEAPIHAAVEHYRNPSDFTVVMGMPPEA